MILSLVESPLVTRVRNALESWITHQVYHTSSRGSWPRSSPYVSSPWLVQTQRHGVAWPTSSLLNASFLSSSDSILLSNASPANTGRWPNVGLMLGHRLRRWPNIDPALGQRLVIAGWLPIVSAGRDLLAIIYRIFAIYNSSQIMMKWNIENKLLNDNTIKIVLVQFCGAKPKGSISLYTLQGSRYCLFHQLFDGALLLANLSFVEAGIADVNLR